MDSPRGQRRRSKSIDVPDDMGGMPQKINFTGADSPQRPGKRAQTVDVLDDMDRLTEPIPLESTQFFPDKIKYRGSATDSPQGHRNRSRAVDDMDRLTTSIPSNSFQGKIKYRSE